MSVPRDMARHSDPERDEDESERPTTKIRRLASRGNLGEPPLGAGDSALSNTTRGDVPSDISVLRPPFGLAAESRWPAPAGWSGSAVLPPRTLQRRDVAFLVGSLGLVLAVVLVATALVLGPVLSLFSHTSPGPPVAAGPPLAASPPTTTATATVPTTSATFVTLDTATQGNWQQAYGSAGYLIVDDAQQLPASIHVTPSGTTVWEWLSSTTNARALARPENPLSRVAASWLSNSSFSLDVNITDGHPYQLAVYVLDWDQQNPRIETVSVVDTNSGRVLDTRQLRVFGIGEYLVWRVSGHITIQVTNNGSINAVVSGLFFAPAAS